MPTIESRRLRLGVKRFKPILHRLILAGRQESLDYLLQINTIMPENPYDSPTTTGTNSSPYDQTSQEARYNNELQNHVNSLLIRGIVFSVIWILGFGLAYSVFLALRAWRIIRRSEGAVRGMGRVWWCFIVGGFGVCTLVIGLICLFIKSR